MIAALMLFNAVRVNASNDAYYTNRDGIEMTEEEYNNLLGQGFTTDQIYRMKEDEFEANKDIQATLVAETQQYVKTTYTLRNGITTYQSQVLSEDELEVQLNQLNMMQSLQPINSPNVWGSFEDGVSWDTFKSLTTYIACLDDSYMRYKMDMQYVTIPSTSERYYDLIGIAIEANKVFIASPLMFREDWVTTGNTFGYDDTGYYKIDQYGGSFLFELPGGSLQLLESYLYYNVEKKNGVGTITYLAASGDYAHAYNSVDYHVMNYYTLDNIGGFSFGNPYGGVFDGIAMAVGTFVGEW